MVKVFVIILNWNQAKLTEDCVNSVLKSNVKNFELEIVVVDNGSQEKLQIADINIKILNNKQNLGFAAGNNIGMKYALENDADYVLVLNNDTIIDKSLISNMLKTMEANRKIGALSPKIYFAKGFEFHDKYKEEDLGKVIWYAGGQIDWDNIYGSNRGVDEVDRGQYQKLIATDFATGACVMYRAQALKEVGLFNEKYFMYLEDVDLSQRLKLKKWNVMCDPSGIVWHKVAQSSGVGSNLNDYFISRNRLLFGMRYARLRTKIALVKESIRLLLTGRPWQKAGIKDFYRLRLGKGSWQ